MPTFREIPDGNIEIGNQVAIGTGVIFEITKSGRLAIGNHVTIGDYDRFSSIAEIKIGPYTAIAENVSLRGSFHKLGVDTEIVKQNYDAGPVHIGHDVLLGAGTVVLQNTTIPDGAVIGTLSLVKSSDNLHAYGIFAGSPLRHIRDRQ
jgi:galactoside O-acetyltransferase